MSVASARAFLAIWGVVLICSVVWFIVGLSHLNFDFRQMSAGMVVPAVAVVVSAVFILSALLLFGHFCEATIEYRAGSESGADADAVLVIRWVLGSQRSIRRADVRQIVVIPHLALPSRSGSATVLRAIVTTDDGSRWAFTPRNADIATRLTEAGFTVEVDDEALTPSSAFRRYPGSIGSGERVASHLTTGAVIIGGVVLVWGLWEALHL